MDTQLENDEKTERERLEAIHGQVWNTEEVTQDFRVVSFFAPFVFVIRRSDGKHGSLTFQDMPRFYYNFRWPAE